jgi:hypothetical protein
LSVQSQVLALSQREQENEEIFKPDRRAVGQVNTAVRAALSAVTQNRKRCPMKARHLFFAASSTFFAGLAFAVGPAAAYQAFSHDYKAWSLTCDNVRRCEAAAYGEEEGTNLLIVLQRDAGPDGAATLQFATRQQPLSMNVLRLDGHPLALDPQQWKVLALSESDAVYRYRLVTHDPAAIDAWLVAVRNGQTVSVGDPARKDAPQASLAGLSASLLAIDATQGRLDTVTAWLRKGDKPAAAVPPAAPLPLTGKPMKGVAPLSEAEQRTLVDATLARFHPVVQGSTCVDSGDDDDARAAQKSESAAYALTSKEAVVALGCSTGGAYNHTSLMYRVQRHPPYAAKPLDFGTQASAGLDSATVRNELTETGYDPASGELSSFVKARGLGDCGTLTTWIFDGERFQLSEISEMGSCVGISSDDWPRLYRSRQAE